MAYHLKHSLRKNRLDLLMIKGLKKMKLIGKINVLLDITI